MERSVRWEWIKISRAEITDYCHTTMSGDDCQAKVAYNKDGSINVFDTYSDSYRRKHHLGELNLKPERLVEMPKKTEEVVADAVAYANAFGRLPHVAANLRRLNNIRLGRSVPLNRVNNNNEEVFSDISRCTTCC